MPCRRWCARRSPSRSASSCRTGRTDHIVPAEPYGTIFAGSWPINNQVMYEALEFAGYDAKLVMGTDGHNTKQGGAILPDALRWLWRGYPAPIVVHEPAAAQKPGWDPSGTVFSTIFVDKPWQQVGGDYGSVTSLTADSAGNVYFADSRAATVDRADANGKIAQFAEPPNDTSILRMGANDRLYTYSPLTGEIVSSNTATGTASDQKTIARNLVDVADFAITQNGPSTSLDGSTATIGVIDSSGHHVGAALDRSGRGIDRSQKVGSFAGPVDARNDRHGFAL